MLVQSAAKTGDTRISMQQVLRSNFPQCNNKFGFDHLDLPRKVWLALMRFMGGGVSVAGGRHFTIFAI